MVWPQACSLKLTSKCVLGCSRNLLWHQGLSNVAGKDQSVTNSDNYVSYRQGWIYTVFLVVFQGDCYISKQSSNQLINQSINQPINQSINQSIDQANNWSVHYHMCRFQCSWVHPWCARVQVSRCRGDRHCKAATRLWLPCPYPLLACDQYPDDGTHWKWKQRHAG